MIETIKKIWQEIVGFFSRNTASGVYATTSEKEATPKKAEVRQEVADPMANANRHERRRAAAMFRHHKQFRREFQIQRNLEEGKEAKQARIKAQIASSKARAEIRRGKVKAEELGIGLVNA